MRERIERIYDLIVKGCEIFDEIQGSVANDQNDRSLIDWIPICNAALKEAYHAASSKYYAITPEGKKKHLSPKYIKEKIPKIQKFVFRYRIYVPFYIWFVRYMLTIAINDPTLFKELKKMELMNMREDIPGLLQMFRNKLIEIQGDTKGTFNNQNANKDKKNDDNNDYYEYVEFRYFDKKTYAKQKLKIKQGKRNSNPDGWKTCCILKPDELSHNILELLQNGKKLK